MPVSHDCTMLGGACCGRTSAHPTETDRALGSREHFAWEIRRAHAVFEVADARPRSDTANDGAATVPEEEQQASAASRALLRASLTAYVNALRADDLPPERMLRLVKSAVTDALPDGTGTVASRLLVEDAVRWSIETYYDGG